MTINDDGQSAVVDIGDEALPAIVDINLERVTLFADRLDEIVVISVGTDERLCLAAGDADVLSVAVARAAAVAGGWEIDPRLAAAEAEADAADGE
jgi:hypothetical protein